MGKRTPLYSCHLMAKATMVEFAGWDMPLHYGSQVQEHQQVRQTTGMFDISHMTIIDCQGTEATAFLRRVLANNVERLIPGKALYTCMLNENGGIIDDLIVYKITDSTYRLVVNAATHDKDLAWLQNQSSHFAITLTERNDLAMVAIQGPLVYTQLPHLFNQLDVDRLTQLPPFHAIQCNDYFIGATGYTGEKGFEVMLPADQALDLWQKFIAIGIQPCGLGARDTLRLEAGLNLYGLDMDESVTPLESNLAWTIAWEPNNRDFIGRPVLEQQKKMSAHSRLVGILLKGPGVLRRDQKVFIDNQIVGAITSGSFSPTLNKGIALARIRADHKTECMIEIRGKQVPAQIVKPPFIKK